MTNVSNEDLARALVAASGIHAEEDRVAAIAGEIGADGAGLLDVARRLRSQAEWQVTTEAVADHSQCGEFRVILKALVARAAAPGIVVEVGARERKGSNAYDLIASFGWRGVLVEAFPPRAEQLHAEFGEGDYRVVQCAVGTETGRMPLWFGRGAVITSLLPDVATQFGGEGQSIEVDVRRLPDVLAECEVPHDFDLVSVDIEGIDAAVVNDLIVNSPWRPRYIIVEALHGFQKPLHELGFAPEVIAAYGELYRTLPNLILERR